MVFSAKIRRGAGTGGTNLGAAPDGLEDDEVLDLAEPGDVLRAREDAGADHRDPRKARAAVAIPRHAHSLSTLLGFLSALPPPPRDSLSCCSEDWIRSGECRDFHFEEDEQ